MIIPPYLRDNEDGSRNNLTAEFRAESILNLKVQSTMHEHDSEWIEIESYHIDRYNDRTLNIQVNFLNPDYLSLVATEKDQLMVDLIKPLFFLDYTGQHIQSYTLLECEINRQMSSIQQDKLQQFEQRINNAIQAFSWTTFVGQLAMSYSLKYLWNTINILQFAVFISQWQLCLPNNGRNFLKLLKNLALMEFIPTDKIVDFISRTLGLESEPDCEDCVNDSETDTRRLQEETELLDTVKNSAMSNFGSNNLVQNLGIMLVIALAIVLLLLLLRILKCLKHRYQWIKKLHKQIHEKIFYNLFIRYVLQSTLKVQIATCTTIKLVVWSTTSGKMQGLFSVIIVAAFT